MVCVGCIQPAISAFLQHYKLRSCWKCVTIIAMYPHSSQRNPSSVLGTWAPQTRSRSSMCSPGSPGCWGKSRKNCINFTHMQWWNPFLELLAWALIHLGSIFCTLSRKGPQPPQGFFLRNKIHSSFKIGETASCWARWCTHSSMRNIQSIEDRWHPASVLD